MVTAAQPLGAGRIVSPAEERKVIFASSLGTVFEWYDFYLYGSLAAVISKQFFAGVNETTGFIFALLAFAAGFAVRPFGALFFGRLGDLIGRKYTFLVTILIMGISTALVGILPNYAAWGVLSPVILIALRLLQGLALGGEYGGAATYVAEHAPMGKRGLFTSWIQTTATMGLFLSLLVILACREAMSPADFDAWGWRIPFLVSVLLLAISVWIRMSLSESPVFQKMKAEGKGSKSPLKDSFGNARNLKLVIIALLGLTAGQAVVWYTGQFYALFYLTQTLKVDAVTANVLIALALLIGTPGFIFFGWLSDKIGRKPIILGGCLIAALTYFPIYSALTHAANPGIFEASAKSPVTVVADPATCSFQFNPTGTAKFTSPCDLAKGQLQRAAVPYANEKAAAGAPIVVKVGSTVIEGYDAKKIGDAITAAGYPTKADPAKMNKPMVLLLLVIQVIYVTAVYGPIAAMLVEMFPTRIRYTSMSLPYHIGNGWFGGFVPPVAVALVAWSGDIYYGLWYPVIIASMTFVVGLIFIRETKDVDIRS
jgi:MFS family permease